VLVKIIEAYLIRMLHLVFLITYPMIIYLFSFQPSKDLIIYRKHERVKIKKDELFFNER
jgi:hypothetical protein